MWHGLDYPCRKHAAKVFEQLLRKNGAQRPMIYLKGHSTTHRDDTDRELPFHQEANFTYLTGAATIRAASVVISLVPEFKTPSSGHVTQSDVHTVLFLPPVDPADVMWCGLPPTPQEVHRLLPSLSDVKLESDLDSYLTTLKAQNTLVEIQEKTLLESIHEARTRKTEEEIEILRKANAISSAAHEAVMVASRSLSSELEAECVFLNECRRKGAKQQAYEPIFGHGTNAGTLHYVENDAKFGDGFSGLLLADAGCELFGYASDITRTFPIGNAGKFTDRAREIYEIVLEMQSVALENIKAGVDWRDLQVLMHKVAAKGLLRLGILKNLTVEEAYEDSHVLPFFPHGLGHFLGLDTHDVAGLPEGKGSHPSLKYLRLQRVLEIGNVVTVEPGLYFNQFLLEPTRKSAFVDQSVLEKYLDVGGVRIEDNVVVREGGCENLTSAAKSVEEVQRLCGGGRL